MSVILIYGANGFTGRLVVAEALRRNMPVVMGGRNKDALVAMASDNGLPWRAFSVDEPDAVDAALAGVDLLLNCAGPFVRTAAPLLAACLRRRVHYLDITGELPVFEHIFGRDEACQSAGIVAIPGVGWDVVPTDCLVMALAARLPDAHRLTISIAGDTGALSVGTRRSALGVLSERGLIERRGGSLVDVVACDRARSLPILDGAPPVTSIVVPMADLVSAWRATGITDIACYLGAPGLPPRLGAVAARALQLLSRVPLVNGLLIKALSWRKMPGKASTSPMWTAAWAEAATVDGRAITGRVVSDDGYRFTARAAIEAARRVSLGAVSPGALTPAQAFGEQFVDAIEGAKMTINAPGEALPRAAAGPRMFQLPSRLGYVAGLISLRRLRISDDERAFVRRELDNADHMLTFICMSTGVIYHLGAAWFFAPVSVPEYVVPMMAKAHYLAAAGIVGTLAFTRHDRLFRWIALGGYVAVAGYFSWALGFIDGLSLSQAMFLYLTQTVLVFYFVTTFPFSVPGCLPFTLFGILAAVPGLLRFPDLAVWFAAGSLLLMTMCTTKLWDILGTIERAVLDVRQRFALAPAEVVRTSIRLNLRVDELFRPRLRRCVCLSSDWRNYQTLSAQLSASELESLLSAYYAEVSMILQSSIVRGNYFSDWIADELFLVTYADRDEDLASQLSALFDACHEILRRKNRIFSRLATAPGIDIGLSLGEAYVGMMGPPGHRKATALGEVPGRARRLQSVGKDMRSAFGDMDRIVFGSDVLMAIRSPVPVQEVHIDPKVQLREVPDRTLFVSSPWLAEDALGKAVALRPIS